MSVNKKQENFLSNLTNQAQVQANAYAKAFSFRQEYNENFAITKTYDLLDMSTDLLKVFYGVTVGKIDDFISRNCRGYTRFWTDEAVDTQEHGKQARAIMNASDRKHSKTKQADFLVRLTNYAVVQMFMYAMTEVLKKDYEENFAAGQGYDLASLTQEELDTFGVSVAGVANFITYNCTAYINFWTNEDVVQGDHGVYARAVMDNVTYIN